MSVSLFGAPLGVAKVMRRYANRRAALDVEALDALDDFDAMDGGFDNDDPPTRSAAVEEAAAAARVAPLTVDDMQAIYVMRFVADFEPPDWSPSHLEREQYFARLRERLELEP